MAGKSKRFAVFVEVPRELLHLIELAQEAQARNPRSSRKNHSALQLPVDLPKLLVDLKMQYVEAAMKAANGNITVAAKSLGLKRTALSEYLRKRADTGGFA